LNQPTPQTLCSMSKLWVGKDHLDIWIEVYNIKLCSRSRSWIQVWTVACIVEGIQRLIWES
jgi:hypothetical protein